MHSVTAACSNSLFTMTALPAEGGAPESCTQRLIIGGGDGSVSLFEGDGRSFRAAASLVVDGSVSAVQVTACSIGGERVLPSLSCVRHGAGSPLKK